MDKERIREVALKKYDDSEFRIPNAYCFIEGAEWLQSQPLSERLTEDEKTMIINIYNRIYSMFDMADIEEVIKRRIIKVEDDLQRTFGKELFNNIVKK